MGLPEAQTFPWDDNKGLYLLNGYHNLHCLVGDQKTQTLQVFVINVNNRKKSEPQSENTKWAYH